MHDAQPAVAIEICLNRLPEEIPVAGNNALRGSGPAGSLDHIRADLEAQIGKCGLRGVARAVGMSPSGLKKVVDGTYPHRRTLGKLGAWHKRHLTGDSRTAADLALEVLLGPLPEDQRDEARRQIQAILHACTSRE